MGGKEVDHGYKGKGSTLHFLTDSKGSPLAVSLTSAKGDERKQVVSLLENINYLLEEKDIVILEGDKGYDSRHLRVQLLKKGIFPIIPYRGNRIKIASFVKRVRWKIERTISWLKRKFRRIATRWERLSEAYFGIVTVGFCYFWIRKIVG